jgi:hypothetical protein
MITYRVIGKRPGLLPEVETVCDEWLGMTLGEVSFGVAITILPDGLVIEVTSDDGVRYAETCRMALVGIDPANPGTMDTARRANPANVTKDSLKAEYASVRLLFRDWQTNPCYRRDYERQPV